MLKSEIISAVLVLLGTLFLMGGIHHGCNPAPRKPEDRIRFS
jgi:hypothetical protein